MMLSLWVVRLLKKLCRRSMLRIVVLSRSNYSHYDNLPAFCSLEVGTDHGPFVFHFKEDRRKRGRNRKERLVIKTYIVELVPPVGLTPTGMDLSDKIVLVVKLAIFRTNYTILTQVLTDVYLETMLNKAANDTTAEPF